MKSEVARDSAVISMEKFGLNSGEKFSRRGFLIRNRLKCPKDLG